MRVPINRFRSLEFYGDSNWHSTTKSRSDYYLSVENPFKLIIGNTTEINESYGPFTKLRSNWLWRYNFSSANSTNFWSSSASNGSNGSAGIDSLGLNISTGTTYTVAEGNTVCEAYVTTGSDSTITKTPVSTIRFASSNDWYFSSISSYPSASNRAIVARFKASYIADLPTVIYRLNGRSITWVTSHPLYILLEGQEFTIA